MKDELSFLTWNKIQQYEYVLAPYPSVDVTEQQVLSRGVQGGLQAGGDAGGGRRRQLPGRRRL